MSARSCIASSSEIDTYEMISRSGRVVQNSPLEPWVIGLQNGGEAPPENFARLLPSSMALRRVGSV